MQIDHGVVYESLIFFISGDSKNLSNIIVDFKSEVLNLRNEIKKNWDKIKIVSISTFSFLKVFY